MPRSRQRRRAPSGGGPGWSAPVPTLNWRNTSVVDRKILARLCFAGVLRPSFCLLRRFSLCRTPPSDPGPGTASPPRLCGSEEVLGPTMRTVPASLCVSCFVACEPTIWRAPWRAAPFLCEGSLPPCARWLLERQERKTPLHHLASNIAHEVRRTRRPSPKNICAPTAHADSCSFSKKMPP